MMTVMKCGLNKIYFLARILKILNTRLIEDIQ